MLLSDRPLLRSLIKIATRATLGKRYAHFQDRFPGVKLGNVAVDSDHRRALIYKGRDVLELQPLSSMHERAAKELCIVGSGPSIAEVDPRRLSPNSAVTLNGAIHLLGDVIEHPLAVAVEDERFVFRHFELIREKIIHETICLFSIAVLRAICERDVGWLADRHVILIDNICRPYGGGYRSPAELQDTPGVLLNEDKTAGISLHPDRGIFQAGSVAVTALQFALSCRPRSIGFMGVDISNASQPRFYESESDQAFSGVARAENQILEHIKVAISASNALHIELLNFSSTSALIKCGLSYDARFARGIPREFLSDTSKAEN